MKAEPAVQTECLNCTTSFRGKYCPQCGQAASTQRFSIRTLWDGEFLAETFQLNRGLLRTLIALLYRPGHVTRDYLDGKRKGYFNFLGLFLLLVAADIYLRSQSDLPIELIMQERFAVAISNAQTTYIERVIRSGYRITLLVVTPMAGARG